MNLKNLAEKLIQPKSRRSLVAASQPFAVPVPVRVAIVGGCLALWGIAVLSRLTTVQIERHDKLRRLAELQQMRTVEVSSRRGRILDRDGRELARSIEVTSIYIEPKKAVVALNRAGELATALNLSLETVVSRLKSPRPLQALARKITQDQADAVRRLNLPGLQFITENKRFYPKDELAATVLGFVNLEDEGAAGIEKQFDKHLRGTPGKYLVETDARGRTLQQLEQVMETGQDVELTLDERIQYRTEQILQRAVAAGQAKGAMAVVMKPATGEILAMASTPAFNPNDRVEHPERLHAERRNRAVEDTYEPGSVFKMVTYAAALEEKVTALDRKIDCQGGSITLGGHTVVDGGRYGLMSPADAFAVSSNVAAIKLGRMLGKERLLKYVERFGFGRRSNAGFPAESPGTIGGLNRWSDLSYTSLPIGYEVTVTPLQVAAAVSALANDGLWVQPHVLRRIISPNGETMLDAQPESRRVVSTETAREVRGLMRGVVERGTAKLARCSYTAGGKTGTAKKFDHALKRYSESRYFASFAGFAPASRPELVVVITMDEPPLGLHHGGQAAAPIFKEIIEASLPLMNVTPDAEINPTELIASNLEIPEERDPDAAPVPLSGTKSMVPAATVADVAIERDDTSKVTVSLAGREREMPNLIGLGLRSAAMICAKSGIRIQATGFGVVTEQSPQPGEPVAKGRLCRLTLGENRPGGPP